MSHQVVTKSEALASGLVAYTQLAAAAFCSYLGGSSIRDNLSPKTSLTAKFGATSYYWFIPALAVLFLILLIIGVKKNDRRMLWITKLLAAVSVAFIVFGIVEGILKGKFDLGI